MNEIEALFLVGIAALGVACSAPSAGESLGRERAEIVGGSIDTGDPAVVAVWVGNGDCTGTLISPRVVLTAAHCIENTSAPEMAVFFGTDANQGSDWIDVLDAQAHPSGDIAAVTIAQTGPAAPIPLTNHVWTQSDKGMPARIVGFGVTSETGEDSGVKRQAMTEIVEWDSEFMYTDGHVKDTCYGDSGGPAFAMFGGTEYLVGVTSFGTAECGTDMSGYSRVDVYREWVKQYIATHDSTPLTTCDPDGLCNSDCHDPDPDLDCESAPGGGAGAGGSGGAGTSSGVNSGHAASGGGSPIGSIGGGAQRLDADSSDSSGCQAARIARGSSGPSSALVLVLAPFFARLHFRRQRR